MSTLLTVRNALFAVLGAGVLVLVWLTAGAMLEAQARRDEAGNVLRSAAIGDSLVAAAQAWAAERGLAHAALQGPEAATTARHQAIDEHRRRADTAISDALERLRARPDGAERRELINQTQARVDRIQGLRGRIDEALGKPRAARDQEVLETWLPAITELIMASQRLRTAARERRRTTLPGIEALRDLRHVAWVMAEFAERETALIGGIIAADEPLVLEELVQLPAFRGRRDQAWATIEAYAREPEAPPEVVAAISQVRQDYFDAFEGLRGPVVRAGVEGAEYPVDADAWLARSASTIAPVLQLGEVAGEAARRLAGLEVAAGLRQLIVSGVILIAIFVAGALAAWIVTRWIVTPLARLTSTMRALAGGDASVPVAAAEGPGEIGEVARALQVFRDSAEARGREFYDANRALQRLNERLVREITRLLGELGSALSPPDGQPRGVNGTNGAAEGRVLVVDSDVAGREALARRLVDGGYDVTAAAGGREALALLQADEFDLVLLEIAMPEMSGFEILARLKANKRLRRTAVLMIADGDGADGAARCIEAGAEDLLPRSLDPALFRARVGACLAAKRGRDRERDYLDQLRAEKARFEGLLAGALPSLSAARLDDADAGASYRISGAVIAGLSEREARLKREIEAVLIDADEKLAANGRLTSRNLASIMERTGRHRFQAQTLRQIIDRRYPPMRRLGLVGNTRNK